MELFFNGVQIFSPKNVHTNVSPIYLQIILLEREMIEIYGTEGTFCTIF